MPETGPDRPKAPDEAGVSLEAQMARNHRSVNKNFNKPGTRAKSQHRGGGGMAGQGGRPEGGRDSR